MEFIADPDDPRIAAYRAIRDRDLASLGAAGGGHGGLFVAEGAVVMRQLLGPRSRFAPASVLVSDARAAALPADLAALLERAACPVYVASPPVLDAIVGFPIHRGLLALGRRGPVMDPSAWLAGLPRRALVVVAIGLANHDNVGGVFRNAAAFGADAVLLDATSCDPLYRKAIRVSVGAALTVPWSRGGSADSWTDALAASGFDLLALAPGGATALEDVRWGERTALILGAEGPGLPPALLARTRPVSVRMAAGFDSLNVATASGVALWAARVGMGSQA